MNLAEKRHVVQRLLDRKDPADALAVYYAFHHPDDKVKIEIVPSTASTSGGYICSAMTGIDLFRPMVTMRLPINHGNGHIEYEMAVDLFYRSLGAGMPVLISTRAEYHPLLGALFDVDSDDLLRILTLDRQKFRPVINVLVTKSESSSGMPRYVIRRTETGESSHRGEILASAGLNWQSPDFAEIYVHTKDNFRRMGLGQSVVAALVGEVLASSRMPVYLVSEKNEPSMQLAKSVGFVDKGIRQIYVEASLRTRATATMTGS